MYTKEQAKIYRREYYLKNKDKIQAKNKKSYLKNQDKRKEYAKQYREQNPDKVRICNDNWRKNNKEKFLETVRLAHKRDKLSIQYRIKKALRSRLKNAIKHTVKSGSSIQDLGCSIEELKVYLESLFQPGMNWDNWSFNGWHIDHIKPLSLFDLSDRKQYLEACHYTNLQPLWAKDNLSKGNKFKDLNEY